MVTENPLDSVPLCPTCHSKISPSGKRKKQEDGVDSQDRPVPQWSGDPIFTPDALNGSDYLGVQFIDVRAIKELQDARKSSEIELAITPLTEFSPILGDTGLIQATHITELRISTERIASAIGFTLAEYFSLDDNGVTQPSGPKDVENKTEWTDVKRGEKFNSNNRNKSILIENNTKFLLSGLTNTEENKKETPTMLEGSTLIKGIHIEDLRHPLPATAWTEFFSTATPSVFDNFPFNHTFSVHSRDVFITDYRGKVYPNGNAGQPGYSERYEVAKNDVNSGNSHKFITDIAYPSNINPQTDPQVLPLFLNTPQTGYYPLVPLSKNKKFLSEKMVLEYFFTFSYNGHRFDNIPIVYFPSTHTPGTLTVEAAQFLSSHSLIENLTISISQQLNSPLPTHVLEESMRILIYEGGSYMTIMHQVNSPIFTEGESEFFSFIPSFTTITDTSDKFYGKKCIQLELEGYPSGLYDSGAFYLGFEPRFRPNLLQRDLHFELEGWRYRSIGV